MSDNERDELAWDVFRADNANTPTDITESEWDRIKSDETYAHMIADGLLAAGYRKPRTITTVEELDALPVGSLLLDVDGDVCQRFRSGWRATINEPNDDPWLSDTLEVDLPATVLHEPAEASL